MKININKIKFLNIMTSFIGFLMLTYFIWFRYLRVRLPRDIPFDLTFYSFMILLIICGTYIYVLYRILFPKLPHKYLLTLMKQISKLFYPLIILDDSFKKHTNFMEYMMSFIIKLITKLKLYNTNNYYNFYLVLYMGPKLILLFAFLFDIFYLSKLELFYMFIPLSLIPLLYNYLIYSLKKQLEIYLQFLDENCDVQILSTNEDALDVMHLPDYLNYDDYKDKLLKVKLFVEMQADNLVFDYKDLYEYTCFVSWDVREDYAKKHNLTFKDILTLSPETLNLLSKPFLELISKTVYLQAFIQVSDREWSYKKLILRWNILLISLYLLCWSYILFISFHTLPENSFTWLCEIQDLEEPFSILKLII